MGSVASERQKAVELKTVICAYHIRYLVNAVGSHHLHSLKRAA